MKQLSKFDFLEGQKEFINSKKEGYELDIYNQNYSDSFIKGYEKAEEIFNSKVKEYTKDNYLRYDFNDLKDDFELTNDLQETLWITPDNKKIWGEYDMGIRGTDHRSLLDIYDLDRDDIKSYNTIHNMGFIRVVPETQIALIDTRQNVTNEQEESLKKGGFQIVSYDTLEKTNNRNIEKEAAKSVDLER